MLLNQSIEDMVYGRSIGQRELQVWNTKAVLVDGEEFDANLDRIRDR